MKHLDRLKKEARTACTYRGHDMKPFSNSTDNRRASSECRICGATVQCNTHPAPNDIDLGGNAVAINCGERRPRT